MHQAQDTFTAQLRDGSFKTVIKGAYLPDSHELVKRDRDGAKVLFTPVDLGEDEPAAKPKAPARPSGKAAS